MATLLECSRPTIQAIELGKLKLSTSLVQRIYVKTGVNVRWLLDDDVTKPILDVEHKPYTKERFEGVQASFFLPAKDPARETTGLFETWWFFARHVNILKTYFIEAYKQDKSALFGYKLLLATLKAAQETIKLEKSIDENITNDMRAERKHFASFHEIDSYINEFGIETFKELRQKIIRKNKEIPPEVQELIRIFEISFELRQVNLPPVSKSPVAKRPSSSKQNKA